MQKNTVFQLHILIVFPIQQHNQTIRESQQMQGDSNWNINDFEIIKALGSGSFGSVQLVRLINKKGQSSQSADKHKQSSIQKQENLFAIKSVLLNRLNQKQKDNALNEVRLLASIHIPYVIGYKGAFFNNQNQSLCVVMEYADGGDLQHKIQGQKTGFQENYIWKVAYELLMALKMLHQHKIVHRDIKAANIFFAKGIAKLGDLNVSKVAEQGYCQTQTGTPYYTSPQIWKGQKYAEKCDIWSLGCVIYEMCVLKPPFRGKDFPSLYKKVIVGQYQQIPNSYSQDLKEFIRFCLNVNQNNRPSAKQLLETSVLSGMELSLQRFRQKDDDFEAIQLIDPIKCPRVLKFLNNRLPKNQFEQGHNSGIKKNVGFVTRKQIEKEQTRVSFKCKSLRKIRSEKNIQLDAKGDIASNVYGSKKLIKLPPLQKQLSNNQKPVFSSKKIMGTVSIKNVKILQEKENRKLVLF